jgi:hypothetical protein
MGKVKIKRIPKEELKLDISKFSHWENSKKAGGIR